jgi:hypothetical protein
LYTLKGPDLELSSENATLSAGFHTRGAYDDEMLTIASKLLECCHMEVPTYPKTVPKILALHINDTPAQVT